MNVISRYTQPFGTIDLYGQAAVVYQDSSVPLLFPAYYQTGPEGQPHLGEVPPYTVVNIATGLQHNGMQVQVRVENVFNTLGELAGLRRVLRRRVISRTSFPCSRARSGSVRSEVLKRKQRDGL